LSAAGVGRAKAAQVHFAVGDGGVAILGKVVATIMAGVLLVVLRLVGYLVGIICPKGTGYRAVICVAAQYRVGPDNAVRVAVG